MLMLRPRIGNAGGTLPAIIDAEPVMGIGIPPYELSYVEPYELLDIGIDGRSSG